MININPEERDLILRTDFLAFAEAAFVELNPDEPFEPNWHHEAIAALLLNSEGVRTRKFINAPPRSLKSFLVSVAWVAFKLGIQPTHKFTCISYSQDLSLELSSQCRRLMQSALYQRLFPTRLAKAAEDQLKTPEGGFRIATSLEGTLTGRGAQTLIVDDPLSAKDALSEAKRKSANQWFTNTLLSRLNDKRAGAIFVVAQRLHQEDLTGVLIEAGWDGLVLPAIAPKDITIKVGNWSHLWMAGEPLQKARELLTILDAIRKDDVDVFAAQYLQDPVPEAGNMLKLDWLKYYEAAPTRLSSDHVVISVDTALKATKTSDYSACLVFLVRNRNEAYLIDVWRKKAEFPELCDSMIELIRKHSPDAILIEDTALGAPLINHLKRFKVNGIIPITPTADKRTRMYGETVKLMAGSLIVPQAAPYLDEFIHEYRAFPSGKHDDQVDALSQMLANLSLLPSGNFIADFGWGDFAGGPFWSDALLSAPSPAELLGYRGRY